VTDPFAGKWRIDLESGECRVWDDASGGFIEDRVGDEHITIRVEDDVQDYEVLFGDGPIITMGYTTRYDDMAWQPYTVRAIEGVPEDEDPVAAAQEFRHKIRMAGRRSQPMEIGKPISYVVTVRTDERTHYRITKTVDGRAQYSMLRRMAEDGETYMATVLDREGVVRVVRKFRRES